MGDGGLVATQGLRPAMQRTRLRTAAFWTVLWLLFVRFLRRLRRRRLEAMPAATFEDRLRVSFAYTFVEMPFLDEASLQFGLFRTFGIPSISAILAKTGAFKHAGVRRLDSTALLVQEFFANGLRTEEGVVRRRCEHAVKRLNLLHGRYRKEISNGDLVYVLCIFITEPLLWAAQLSPVLQRPPAQQRALLEAWLEIGAMMGIKDMPQTLPDFYDFRRRYEAKHLRYRKSNRDIAEATIDIFCLKYHIPLKFRGLVVRMVSAFCDDGLREAFGWPAQPWLLGVLLKGVIKVFYGVLMPALLPPRPFGLCRLRAPPDAAGDDDLDRVRMPMYFDVRPSPFEKGYAVAELGSEDALPGKLGKLGTFEDYSGGDAVSM